MRSETRVATLECAGNSRVFLVPQVQGAQWELGAVSNAEWTGVPLKALLERAGLQEDACEIVLEGADRGKPKEEPVPPDPISYVWSLPRAKAISPAVLIAYQMNDRDLSRDHGFPVRAIVPGYCGMASVKWLTGIRAVREPFRGYWQTSDYAYWALMDGKPGRRPLGEMHDGTASRQVGLALAQRRAAGRLGHAKETVRTAPEGLRIDPPAVHLGPAERGFCYVPRCTMASSRRKLDRLDEVAVNQLVDALQTCRLTLREVAADLRFETPAAHGCRMVIAAIDALAHLITGRPYLFAEKDAGTRRNQTAEEIGDVATERLLDALGECRGAARRAMDGVKVQGVMYNAIGMLTSSIDVLARMLTGEPAYYGTEGACGAPGRRSWSNDRAQRKRE
jgi:hypothetical protein